MASRSDRDDCRTAFSIFARSPQYRFRRLSGHLKAPRRIFPQILSRRFRIAGTFCRQRWFARYARSESLLCLHRPALSLQTMAALERIEDAVVSAFVEPLTALRFNRAKENPDASPSRKRALHI